MKLTQLRVNHIETPAGFNITPVSLSWKVEDAGNAKFQKTARIIVKRKDVTVFDSGEDSKADSLDYRADIELLPRTRYEWSVCVTADNGETA